MDLEFENELQKLSQYADRKLNSLFKQMLTALFKNMPDDPTTFMIDFLKQYQKNQSESINEEDEKVGEMRGAGEQLPVLRPLEENQVCHSYHRVPCNCC